MIQAALDALVRRAGAAGPPGLADAVPGLKTVRTWEGEWDALAGPKRLSVRTPAALVSLIDLVVVDLGRTLATRRALAPRGPQDTVVAMPPTPHAVGVLARPVCRIEVAVTVLSGGRSVETRAAGVLTLAEQILPVMVDHALEALEGTNLNSDALRKAGLSAFVLVGRREIEITPADAARELPSAVALRGTVGAAETVYPPPDC